MHRQSKKKAKPTAATKSKGVMKPTEQGATKQQSTLSKKCVVEKKKKRDDDEDYKCRECGGVYVLGAAWVQCDTCKYWMHVKCTRLKGRSVTAIENLGPFKCQKC